ncbi:MAG TPA: hypothetical protein VGQ16_10765 [Vicinamibacterales bacterium]|jgi:hypothetical protein|nr:hypothetical protein [Vicinamibacterales bacterium]
MTNKTFIALVIAIALLVSAMIDMHRPRSGTSTRALAPHGDR